MPGEEKLKKPMHKVGKPRKIAIRQHPESKGYRREDIEREEMKAKKIKKNEEIECKFLIYLLIHFSICFFKIFSY